MRNLPSKYTNNIRSALRIFFGIIVFVTLTQCYENNSKNKSKNHDYIISYKVNSSSGVNPVSNDSQWNLASDFSFLSGLKNSVFIKIKIKDVKNRYYLHLENNINTIKIFTDSKDYWQLPAQNIFFNTHVIPIHEKDVNIEIVKNEYWPYSGLHLLLKKKGDLQNTLLRKHILRIIIGCLFIFFASILWTLIFVRPHEKVAIISFEFFLLLIGIFCISSSSAIHYLYPQINVFPLLTAMSVLLAPIPLFVYCVMVTREKKQFWKKVFYSASLLFCISIPLLLYSLLYVKTNTIFNIASPLLIALSLLLIFSFAVQQTRHHQKGSRIHGWGLFLFCVLFAFDIINIAFDLCIVDDYLSPYGTLLLTVSILLVLESRSFRTKKELEESLAVLENTNESYRRFIPREFFEFLNKKAITDVRLGDNIENEFTILVTDIHGFTTLSEEMTPVENFDFVNSYFNRIVPSINGNNGFIAKYMGDGVMALFPGSSSDAIKCAVDINNILFVYNQSRIARNRQVIKTGIGIHKGTARLGIVGSEKRMQGDIISDTANMAARVEGLTRIYGASTIFSESVFSDLNPEHPYNFRTLDRVKMKGKLNATTVYELLLENLDGKENIKITTLELFKKATAAYLKKDFVEAAQMMQEILEINPDDITAKRYVDSSMFYAINGAPDSWIGITELDKKS